MAKEPSEEALWIAKRAKVEAPACAKMLLLGVRTDGSSFSMDSGLTASEAKDMAHAFVSWVDQCLGASKEVKNG